MKNYKAHFVKLEIWFVNYFLQIARISPDIAMKLKLYATYVYCLLHMYTVCYICILYVTYDISKFWKEHFVSISYTLIFRNRPSQRVLAGTWGSSPEALGVFHLTLPDFKSVFDDQFCLTVPNRVNERRSVNEKIWISWDKPFVPY